MSQILLEALAASIPAAALAFLAGWAVEAMGAGLRLRLAAWTTALVLPTLLVPAMLSIRVLDISSPFAALEPRAAPEPVVQLIQTAAVPTPTPKPAFHLPFAAILLGLIGAGATLRLGQLGLGLRRVARLKATSAPIADPELALRLGEGVRLADTETPVLAGLTRPMILLPRRLLDGLSPEQAALVCAHERAHLAAGDHLSHLMEETMVRVFWFNPLMALARERLAAAREEACDARALQGCDAAGRRAYAQTLIRALKLAGRAEPVAAFTGFRRRGAERRLKAILKPAGPGSWRAALAAGAAGIGLILAIGGVSLAAAAQPADPTDIPASPAPPAAEASPVAPTSPAPPAPPAHTRRHHSVVIFSDDNGEHPHARVDGHPVVIDGDDWDLDSDQARELTPQEKAELKAQLKQAHEAVEKALAHSRAVMAGAHKELIETYGLTAEQQAKIQQQVADAMKQAHAAMAIVHQDFAENDGRVPMRCKLGPDGKATDCVPFAGPVHFMLHREAPPAPGVPPAPAAPPAEG